MAQATFVHEGASIDYTPGAAVAAGDVVVQGELVGVAKTPIAASTLGSLAVDGVFDFAKATGGGTAIAIGVNVYWDDAANQATTNAGRRREQTDRQVREGRGRRGRDGARADVAIAAKVDRCRTCSKKV